MTNPTGSISTPIGRVGQNYGISEGTSKSSSAADTAKADNDMFLRLLVAQMKYQDPNKPTDPSQFLAQTAQFTLVEKMGALASSQAQMLESNQLQAATTMVGSTITWNITDTNGSTVPKTGVVNAVSITNGVPTLLVGADEVALSKVIKVTGA